MLTNTLPIPPAHQFEQLTVLSIAPLIGEAIGRVAQEASVSSLFDSPPGASSFNRTPMQTQKPVALPPNGSGRSTTDH